MSEALAIFAKAPVPGFAKTRLTPPLTPEEAAGVYEASLESVVATALQSDAEVILFFDPARDAEGYFATAYPGIPRFVQEGEDLGARLANAFDMLFTRAYERVAIIGADSPTLPPAYLVDAFATLTRTEAVLGPTHDGGYYLVGLTRPSWPTTRALFEDIRWSTDAVLSETLARAAGVGVRPSLLPEWYDIDHAEDLVKAARDAETGSKLGRLLARWAPGRQDEGE